MKKLQKIIATLTILALLLSPTFNILSFKPKQVYATDLGAGLMNFLKETVLDLISYIISNVVLKGLEQKIMDWGMGRNTTSNTPFPVADWNKFFGDLLDRASAKFVQEFNLTPFCSPLKISLGDRPEITWYASDNKFQYQAACTLGNITDNVEQFFKNPKIGFYGPNAWFELTNPQNNVFGAWVMSMEERERMEEAETKAGDKETAVSNGVKNETATTKTDTEACKEKCRGGSSSSQLTPCQQSCDTDYDGCMATASTAEQNRKCSNDRAFCYSQCPGADQTQSLSYSDVQACITKCEVNTKGISIQEKVKNLGKDISTSITNAMGADIQRVINADEITKLVGIIFSALLNKAITGVGNFFAPKTATQPEKSRAQAKDTFGYLKEFKKKQTGAQVKDIYTETLTSILSAVQSLDRSIIACDDEDKMMAGDAYFRNLSDIFNPEVEALYTNVDGINLKTDWKVLDPLYAPYTVYGYSFGEVPASKIPEKCQAILNQYYNQFKGGVDAPSNASCRNIQSNLETKLPTLVDFQEVNPATGSNPGTEWTTGAPSNSSCAQCMYDHDSMNCPPAPYPPQRYPTTTDPFAGTYNKKGDFYNACRRWYSIASDRCDECLKKVDEKCNQQTRVEKEQCIAIYCNNYEEIANRVVLPLPVPITSKGSLDFYNRCLIEEKKDACYTCVKEYFMPAHYCDEVSDYMARAIIKYPTVIVGTGFPPFGFPDGASVGIYDPILGQQGGECDNDSNHGGNIELGLICRIMPDYSYGGVNICQQNCFRGTPPMTQKELADISDFRPYEGDCGNQYLKIGGRINVWEAIKAGQLNTLSKCCGVLWQNDPATYAKCVGGAGITQATGSCPGGGPKTNPECYCDEGWRPIAGTHLKLNFKCPGGVCPVASDPTCRSSCEEDPFKVPDMSLRNNARLSTNIVTGGSTAYVSSGTCDDPDYPNCLDTAKRTFFENLARIFKPHIPYAIAAVQCDCWTESGQCLYEFPPGSGQEALCNAGDYCDTNPGTNGACTPRENPVNPSRPEMNGIVKSAGNCDCNSKNDCAGGYYCDLPTLGYAPCTAGQYNGKCKQGSTGSCDYIAGAPAGAICSQRTTHGNGATDCCFAGGEEGNTTGITLQCDLSGVNAGEELRVGVANELTTDCNTGALLCIQCSANDPDYYTGGDGFYNTGKQQCYGKIPW